MDACPTFVLKRRSFSFGIDKKQPQPRLFLYTEGEESVRLNKNAHCFAVEPSGWRFTFDASIFVTLFRRFAPFDSPRVHQKTTATAVVFVYGGGGVRAFKQKRTLLRSRTLRLALHFRCKHLRFAIASRRSFRLPPPGTPVALSSDNATVIFAVRQVGLLRSYILLRKSKFSRCES